MNQSFKIDPIIKSSTYKEKIIIHKFKPKCFDIIRDKFGITENVLLESLNLDLNKSNIFKIGKGEGKSGSFFFYSYDEKFLIKTISAHELRTFLGFLNKYSQHITDKSESIITIIVGAYKLKMSSLAPIHIVLMMNSLPKLNYYVGIYIYIYIIYIAIEICV